ncbi:MAG: hypothetical protein ABSF15_15165 [Candidatus Sulfotelmatobacter sp.]|jgi:hypothetical protein
MDSVHVETQSTQMGEVIESKRIQAVSLNGRSYTDLLALQPGVSPYTSTWTLERQESVTALSMGG